MNHYPPGWCHVTNSPTPQHNSPTFHFLHPKKPKRGKQGGNGGVGTLGTNEKLGVLQWEEGAREDMWRRTGSIHGGEERWAAEEPGSL